MTIKEMEEKTGMSRTNIRFYESEGLIQPRRQDNGYRDYSDSDARTLMKVKLLRSMDVPLDQVKAAAFGERRLMEVLQELEQDLARRQVRQERIGQTLEQMKQEDTDFEVLEPEKYLASLEDGTEPEDAPPRRNHPWRRYWARVMDYSLCALLVDLALKYFPVWDYARLPVYLLVMLLLEPLALMLFATTPGKAIFGIRVTDPDGNRLPYDKGVERTWTVLWEGWALNIPVIGHYFAYKSLRDAEDELTLPWEWDTELTYADSRDWRYILYFALDAGLIWLRTRIL